jgi:hypothetical protein
MHLVRIFVAALLVLAFAVSPTAAVAKQSNPFYVALIPPEGISTTDQDSLAVARLDNRVKEGTFCVDLDTEGLATPFTVDIHRRGDGDPVVITVFEDTTDPDPSGCVAVHSSLLREISQDGFAFYIDIHNAEFPEDGLRAFLVPDIVAQLDGTQVAPGPGDSDGAGVAWVVPFTGGDLFVFVNTTDVATPITVELHRGARGTDGPLVATLVEESADPDRGGSVILDRKVTRDIRRNPGAYYLEILNPDFPDGAIRGQLLH